jgi:hypothetical protein
MTEINKYQNGKIYKLVSSHTDKIYVGSTCKERLCQRLAKHKSEFKLWLKDASKRNITSYRLFELGDVEIVLLESVNCKSKDELHKKEREYIEKFKDNIVNHVIPTRTKAEYDSIYYLDNIERINERSKQYYKEHKEKKIESVAQYRENNIEKIKAHDKVRHQVLYDCECGKKQIKKGCKGAHNKTKMHLNFLKNQ